MSGRVPVIRYISAADLYGNLIESVLVLSLTTAFLDEIIGVTHGQHWLMSN